MHLTTDILAAILLLQNNKMAAKIYFCLVDFSYQ